MMKATYFLIIALILITIEACGQNTGNANAAPDNTTTSQNKTAKVTPLTQAEFLKKIDDYKTDPATWKYLGNRPAIIDFYADWCGPCRIVAPILEKLAEEYAGKIDFYKVNTDTEQELAAAFGIQSIPSILFIPMEGQPQMLQGTLPESSLKEAIEKILSVK